MSQPKILYLESAVNQIKRACETSQSSNSTRYPFFFIVGAGLSFPPVPLASTIIKDCKEIVRKRGDIIEEPEEQDPMKIYSFWFNQAFEQRVNRQSHLKSLIKGKNISHANFRLAHLLVEEKISNVVVTPNFDDFLARAIILFGKQPLVCDHPKVVSRINLDEQAEIQIIHVHGTYPFYDCINLDREIEERAQPLGDTTSTMASLLDAILWQRSPIVIGYSGWENDVIMKALKRRLQTPLPYNAYWFCYKQSNIDDSPNWLKDHENVCFVIPQAKQKKNVPHESPVNKVPTSEGIAILSPLIDERLLGKDAEELTLSAVDVLNEINKAFDLKTPTLMLDPLRFFIEQLRNSLPQSEEGVEEKEIYFFSKVIEQVKEAIKIVEQEKQKKVLSPLVAIFDAVRRSQYEDALLQAQAINLEELKSEQLAELSDIIDSLKEELSGNAALEANELSLAINEKLIEMLEKKND